MTALLRVDGVEVRGTLTIAGDDLKFAPKGVTNAADADLLRELRSGSVSWGEAGCRFEQPVTIDAGEDLSTFGLTRSGELQRLQLRASERRTAALPVTALLAEPEGFVLRRGQTLDISTGGMSFVFERDPALNGPPMPPQSGLFGAVIDLPEQRIAGLCEVVSTIQTAVRTGVRTRFDRMRGGDTDAIDRFVALTTEASDGRYAMTPQTTLERVTHHVEHLGPSAPTSNASIFTAVELEEIPAQVLDQRQTEAQVRLQRMRDIAGRALITRVDFDSSKAAFLYVNDGNWAFGTMNRLVDHELTLRLVSQ